MATAQAVAAPAAALRAVGWQLACSRDAREGRRGVLTTCCSSLLLLLEGSDETIRARMLPKRSARHIILLLRQRGAAGQVLL